MKRIIKQLNIMLVLLLLGLTSCNDWLDVHSKVDIKEDEVFDSESGFWDALVGVYSSMSSSKLYGDNLSMSTLDILAYNYTIEYDKFGDGIYNLSKFNYMSTKTRPTINDIWAGMYNAIANANNVLRQLERADKGMFEGDNFNLVKGEALALRAYLHFDLLRMYAKSFKMDKNAPAIPYVRQYSKDKTPVSTVKEVVQLALQDLEEASVYLLNDPVQEAGFSTENIYLMYRQNRMNYYAVQALKARIYLYSEDRENALICADSLIDTQEIIALSTSSTIATNRIMSRELFFNLYKDDLATVSDGYFVPVYDSQGVNSKRGKLLQSYEVIRQIFEIDIYGETKDGRFRYQFNFTDRDYYLSKYEQRSGDQHPGKYRIPMLRLSEMYYISAECTDDMEKAAERINAVRRARGYGTAKLSFASHDEVMDYLGKEYRREFYGEGQMFYFYKRINAPVIADCGINISEKREKVYVFPLPEDELEFMK